MCSVLSALPELGPWDGIWRAQPPPRPLLDIAAERDCFYSL